MSAQLVVCIFEELQALKQAVMARVVTSLIRIVVPAAPLGHIILMPKGPQGQKRPADVIGAAVMVAKIATGEICEI